MKIQVIAIFLLICATVHYGKLSEKKKLYSCLSTKYNSTGKSMPIYIATNKGKYCQKQGIFFSRSWLKRVPFENETKYHGVKVRPANSPAAACGFQ